MNANIHDIHRHPTKELQKKKEDLQIKVNENEILENLKNLVGPSFIFCGSVGIFYGLYLNAISRFNSTRTVKLLFTSSLNSIGRQGTRFANAGAALSLVYCFTRRFINFMFEEEIKEITPARRTFLYGFTTGMIFKSTRGLLPSLLFGSMAGTFFLGLNELKEKYNIKINCI